MAASCADTRAQKCQGARVAWAGQLVRCSCCQCLRRGQKAGLCPTFARNDRNVSPCSTLCCCPVRDSHECTIECAHIHWSENHDLSVLPPFASYFHKRRNMLETCDACRAPTCEYTPMMMIQPNLSPCLINKEQFHYFVAFPVSGSPHNSTSATQTSTIKLIQFSGLRE